MEKSRAIELLEHLAWDRDIERNPYGDALNMAIKALKAQLSQEGTTKDTISRQAAIDAAKDWYEGLICGSVNGLIKRLNALPPAQPEPQEGHWIEGKIYRDVIECNCSECGQLMTTAATVRMNYCPNCGAKMKGARSK